MLYFAVEWVHAFPDEPIHLYHEIDGERYEQRKVEVFRDGSIQSADAFHKTGTTSLAWVSHPPLYEIAADPQFRVRKISADEFEASWHQAKHDTSMASLVWYVRFESAEPVMEDLQAAAARIDTGIADTLTSRALIVFNLTAHPLSGVAVFHADMAWPRDIPLPPVVMSEFGGDAVPSALTDWREGPDGKGRADRRQVSFALRFAVQDVPARGWRTYIAAYADAPGPELPSDAAGESPGLVVVETLRHGGDLSPVGQNPSVAAS